VSLWLKKKKKNKKRRRSANKVEITGTESDFQDPHIS